MWKVDECADANGFATIRPDDGSANGDTDAQPLATVYDWNAARIMAAAPAMLAALQLIVAERGHGGTLDGTPELAAAEAAIAAATGAPICDDPTTAAAANLSRAGLIEAAREAVALAGPTDETGER